MSLPRGLRNNNPGNIRITKDKWQGLREKQEDKSFFQFTEMKWGYRALIRTLQNYRKDTAVRRWQILSTGGHRRMRTIQPDISAVYVAKCKSRTHTFRTSTTKQPCALLLPPSHVLRMEFRLLWLT